MIPPRSVLITGASTGIGLACALRLDRRGWRVCAGVRREADATRLQGLGSGRIATVRLDVTDPVQVAAVRAELEEAVGAHGLDLLVNNAGIAAAGPLEYLPIAEFRRLQEVNVVGLLAVTQAMLPLIRRARGRIINVGSISGRMVNPFTGAYAASKHAVEALSDALRIELAEWGIHVALIEPGMIETPIWAKAEVEAHASRGRFPAEAEALYGPLLDGFARMVRPAIARAASPELVADAVEHAALAEVPRTRYLVGRDARVRLALKRFLPDRVLDALILRLLRRSRGAA
jgi:NAD(P)-dependent dehydrogenase (short-subunit alcohol dehydrogenase family)